VGNFCPPEFESATLAKICSDWPDTCSPVSCNLFKKKAFERDFLKITFEQKILCCWSDSELKIQTGKIFSKNSEEPLLYIQDPVIQCERGMKEKIVIFFSLWCCWGDIFSFDLHNFLNLPIGEIP
jgi:hypothetical protein